VAATKVKTFNAAKTWAAKTWAAISRPDKPMAIYRHTGVNP
jgi:hypothetical protein